MYTFFKLISSKAAPDLDTSQESHTLEDTSMYSIATDEGLEISQRLAESMFVGPDLDAEGEEVLTGQFSQLETYLVTTENDVTLTLPSIVESVVKPYDTEKGVLREYIYHDTR